MTWERMVDADQRIRNWYCDEGLEGCSRQAEWVLTVNGVFRANRCEAHVPAGVHATQRILFYEIVLKNSPPHKHGSSPGCCNTLCGGDWGTGCYCCHHGKFALEMSNDEITRIMAPHEVHAG